MVFVVVLFFYSTVIMYYQIVFSSSLSKGLPLQVRESDGRYVDRKMKISLEGLIIKWARQVDKSSFTNLPSGRWTRCSQKDPRTTS